MALTLSGDGDITGLAVGALPSNVIGGGAVLQVVSVTKTDTFSSSATAYTDITGLSLSITPVSTSSRILIVANLTTVEPTTNNLYLRFVRDSTPIAVGNAAGTRTQATGGFRYPTSDNGGIGAVGMSFVDSPSTTSATTYKIQMGLQGGTGYVNRSGDDADVVGRGRYVSTITAMEIAG